MFEALKNVWLQLRGMNIYVEVTFAAFLAYFFIRHMLEVDVKKAVWVPVLVSFLGQLAYTLQALASGHDHFDIADGVMVLFMTLFQAGMASMMYTVAEKYGLIDKIGAILGKKLDDQGAKATSGGFTIFPVMLFMAAAIAISACCPLYWGH